MFVVACKTWFEINDVNTLEILSGSIHNESSGGGGMMILGGLIGGAILLGILLYNALISSRNLVRQNWSTIDVQLKKRFDLIPNLVATVKSYATHEQQLLTQVTELRSRVGAFNEKGSGGSQQDRMAQEAQLSTALRNVLVLGENYPQLKANENYQQLQEVLFDTESQIAAARRSYNAAVTDYNTKLQTIPYNLFASSLGFKSEVLFETSEAERAVPQVKDLFRS